MQMNLPAAAITATDPLRAYSPWVDELAALAHAPGIDEIELICIAAETDPRGPASTMQALLRGLQIRCYHDATACAMVEALMHIHLPALARRLDRTSGY